MSKKTALFLFHRDLRIQDNRGLVEAVKNYDQIYTAFIFTPEQVAKNKNPYKSDNSVRFMLESLESLVQNIAHEGGKMEMFYGDTEKVLGKLVANVGIDAIIFNRDYTPYARKRDEILADMCKKWGIECKSVAGEYCLMEPGSVRNGQGGYFHKYGAFYETVMRHLDIPKPTYPKKYNFAKISGDHVKTITIEDAKRLFINQKNLAPSPYVHGGRTEGLEFLKRAIKEQKDYGETRDQLFRETSFLSAYVKFGCVSVREVFHGFAKKYGARHDILRQLIWRDFFVHLMYAHPESMNKMYYEKYENIKWHTNSDWIERWKEGKTGFPTVDACMRQINQTGYMHNRGRMLVAYFLVKTLLMDWREGERYFAQKLVDYDVASNLFNWQSIVGGGAYNTAWFRTMSPWTQSIKFDPDAIYIKRWVPELASVSAKDIHKWNLVCQDPRYRLVKYECPMVDFHEQTEKMMKMYKRGLD